MRPVRRPPSSSLVAACAAALLTVLGATALLAQADASAYRIGPQDLLSISVVEIPSLEQTARVDQSGRITLPMVGQIAVAGLTTDQAAARLKKLLEERYVQRATVVVAIQEARSNPIVVLGAVANPGPLDRAGRMSLADALVAAGGLAEGHGPIIRVERRSSNGLSDRVEIEVRKLTELADPKANIPVQSGDVIHVPGTTGGTVFLLGEFGRQGEITFSGRITLLMIIARAGGLGDRASGKIIIKRQTEDGGAREMLADYKEIVGGRAPDVALQDRDILIAKESFF